MKGKEQMDLTQLNFAKSVSEVLAGEPFQDLSDLQLALIGGGCGEVILN
jgi:hypothetical protein